MGYLTTITIYNDGADLLKKCEKELAEKLSNACLGVQKNAGQDYDSLGNHANLLTLQRPRHADCHTLYLHAGNTVTDVNEVSNDSFLIDTFISEMEYHLQRLKELRRRVAKSYEE